MDYPGSLSILVWADQQACKTPVQKLILYYLADHAAGTATCRLDLSGLAKFCCTTEAECEVSLALMQRAGLVQLTTLQDAEHVALPWWRQEARPAKQKPKLPPIEEGVREFLHGCQGGQCWYCGVNLDALDSTPHIDHQHPRSRGGDNDLSNLVLACVTCNVSKRAKTVDEYRAYLIARDGLAADFLFHMEQPK